MKCQVESIFIEVKRTLHFLKHTVMAKLEWTPSYFTICDFMGQNQSHVAIFSYGVKYGVRPHSELQIGEN